QCQGAVYGSLGAIADRIALDVEANIFNQPSSADFGRSPFPIAEISVKESGRPVKDRLRAGEPFAGKLCGDDSSLCGTADLQWLGHRTKIPKKARRERCGDPEGILRLLLVQAADQSA